MPFYDIWEKKTVYLSPSGGFPSGPPGGAHPMPPIYYPPPGVPTHPIVIPPPGGPPPGGYPPVIWPVPPGVGPMPPIYYPSAPPGYPTFPIWGPPGFNPIGPGYPPGIWSGPIIPPGQPSEPPVVLPMPPEFVLPPANPTDPPDFASPGFWAYVVGGTKKGKSKTNPSGVTVGWIQLALNVSEDHEPNTPEYGLPGEWILVYSYTIGARNAWIPTFGGSGTSSDVGTSPKRKLGSSKP